MLKVVLQERPRRTHQLLALTAITAAVVSGAWTARRLTYFHERVFVEIGLLVLVGFVVGWSNATSP